MSLTGTWVSDDYDCPWGVAHTEVVMIVHDGDRITGTKVTGDDCVPAGYETFSGVLRADSTTTSVSWVVGHPHAPASGRHPGTITIASPNLLLATAPGWRELRFRRVEFDAPWRDREVVQSGPGHIPQHVANHLVVRKLGGHRGMGGGASSHREPGVPEGDVLRQC